MKLNEALDKLNEAIRAFDDGPAKDEALALFLTVRNRATVAEEARVLLERTARDKGRVVSSNDLSRVEIADALKERRWWVDPDTFYGYAILPWDASTDKDRKREADYFSENDMMV